MSVPTMAVASVPCTDCTLPGSNATTLRRDLILMLHCAHIACNLQLATSCRPWGSHTAFTNRAGNVVRQIRQGQGEVELCTTAWAKMYESIVSFDLLPAAGSAALGHLETGQPAVGSVHLCEAPGAFISATNHYIRTQR